jgi:tetratricopeptide (TPR) repeat protein
VNPIWVCAAGLSVLVSQAQGPCVGDDCSAVREHITVAAAEIGRDRDRFVAALRELIRSLWGTYGVDAPAETASVQDMAENLGRWDRAIRTYRTLLLDAAGEGSDAHVALAAVYLERGNADMGLKEALAASAVDPARPDAYILQGLAFDLAKRPGDAADAFAKASKVDARRAAGTYGLAERLIAIGDEAGATAALQRFEAGQPQDALQELSGSRAPPAPFVRAGLLRQPAGIAPMFAPSAYARAFQLLAAGALDQAVDEFRTAAVRDSLRVSETERNSDARRGTAAFSDGDLRTAIQDLELAVNQLPDSTEPRSVLGLAYAADEQYKRSIEQLKVVVRLQPEDDRARLALSDVLVLAKRPLDAEQVLRDTLDAIPGSGGAHYQLALLYESLGRFGEAIAELERAAMVPPVIGEDQLYSTLGVLYLNAANLDGALSAYRRRVVTNPNNSDAHRQLGQIYVELGRHQEASAEFTAALLLDPANTEAHASRAQLYLRLGEYAAAEMSARRALERNRAHRAAQYALGTSLMRLGRREEGTAALEEYRRLQASAQAAADQAWQLKLMKQAAQSRVDEGDFDGAAGLLNQVILREPGSAENYVTVGLVLERSGKHQAAIDAFRNALALKPDADVHGYLAAAYAALGRTEDSHAEQVAHDRVKQERLRAKGLAR